MQPFERAWEFDRRLQERSAAHVRRFDRGAALYTESLPRVYDANFIRIDDSEGLDADEAERIADRFQGELRHRKFVLAQGAARLADDLVRRGWSRARIATMEYAGESDPAASGDAELV